MRDSDNIGLRVSSLFLWLLILLIVTFSFVYPFFKPFDRLDPAVIGNIPSRPIPEFSDFVDVVDKKQAFFDYLSPIVVEQNTRLLRLRETLLRINQQVSKGKSLASRDITTIESLAAEYQVKQATLEDTVSSLLTKVDMLPVDLVLVQAANESAWGTSRFARQGYNFFGLWCFRAGCGFVPAQRSQGAKHEVARFNNIEQAVYTYMRNINRHHAYAPLREMRRELRKNQQSINGLALIDGLMRYSERGQAYVDELKAMIRVNKKLMRI